MALVSCPPVVPLSIHVASIFGTAPSYQANLLDAAGEKIAAVFRVPKTGSIRTIRFRVLTVTSGQTLQAGVYTVDGSGLPTTTAYGGMAVGTVAVANNDDNTEKVITLATDASATEGDMVAVTIEFDSAIGNLNVASTPITAPSDPYSVHLGAKIGQAPLMSVGYSDGTYPFIPGLCGWTSATAQTGVNSGTGTADEYALLFSWPTTVRLKGMLWTGACVAGADFEYINYDGTTPVTGMTGTRDGDHVNSTATRQFPLLWNTAEVLAANTQRRLSIRPTTANSVTIMRGTVGVQAAMKQMFDADWQTSRRLNQGAWDDSLTTEFPYIIPIFDQMDDGVGGAGGGPLATGVLTFRRRIN